MILRFLLVLTAILLMRVDAMADDKLASVQVKPVKLSMTFKGLRNTKGKILVGLFNSEKGFPKEADAALKRISVTLEERVVPRIEISRLSPGSYAVSALHDENDNQKLDTNWIGIPREGVAASRDAKGSFGPPKYRDAVLEISHDQEIELTFDYM